MRLINADEFIDIIGNKRWIHVTDYNIAICAVKHAPTVDAVTVVRCDDCIRFRPEGEVWGRCTMAANPMRKKDFCSYGVRKDSDNGKTD